MTEPRFKIGDLVHITHLLLRNDLNYGRMGLVTKINSYDTGHIYLILIDNLQEPYGEHCLSEV